MRQGNALEIIWCNTVMFSCETAQCSSGGTTWSEKLGL